MIWTFCTSWVYQLLAWTALIGMWAFIIAAWRERGRRNRDRARLRVALANLLDDTQHAHHPDCADGPCPVREAREVLEGTATSSITGGPDG